MTRHAARGLVAALPIRSLRHPSARTRTEPARSTMLPSCCRITVCILEFPWGGCTNSTRQNRPASARGMGQGKAGTDILEDGVIRYTSMLRGADSGVLADYGP